MEKTINHLNELLVKGEDYILNTSLKELEKKTSQNKWSKKEILGHLVDSGVNNLQRFTEIQFHKSPYKLRDYHQSNLVTSNFYQKSEVEEILQFWMSINKRIQFVISNLPEELYQNAVLLPSKEEITFLFLIEDYVVHLEYHLNQIIA